MKSVQFKIFPQVPDWRSLEVGSGWDWYLVLRRRLTRAYALLLFGMILFGIGLWARNFMVGFASLVAFAFFIFLWLRDVATKIVLKREVPLRAREGDVLSIRYQIENVSRLPVWSLTLRENFDGTRAGTLVETSSVWLGGLRRRRLTSEVPCDQGMGRFHMGPTELEIADPLGIFVFQISWDDVVAVEVYPRVGMLPDIPLKGRLDSNDFGLYEQLSSGSSVNFMGIRAYVPGDPLKTISWKLSAKLNELMVKVFDRSVSDEVSLLIDMNPALQVGYKGVSTWAHMKEMALRLVRQCIDQGNRVQILSQHVYVPWGTGAEHWAMATMKLSLVDPDFSGQNPGTPIGAYTELVPQASTVFLVTPGTPQSLPDLKELVLKYKAHSCEVVVFLFDALSYLDPHVPEIQSMGAMASLVGRESAIDAFRVEVGAFGVRSYVIERDSNMAKAILESAL